MSRATTVRSGKKKSQVGGASLLVRDRAGRVKETKTFSSERLVLRKGKEAVGVVISMEELRYFEELEDRLDLRDADQALADPVRIPYAEARKKLGL